jgi:multisubunit Na+/H+ antiporter MnhB subunit
MKAKTAISLVVIIGSLLAISYGIAAQATGIIPQTDLRSLARFYSQNTENLNDKYLWAASPEAVTAIVWDYRGFDTLFETSVFFLAIIACVAAFEVEMPTRVKSSKIEQRNQGLSIIVKVVTKIAGLIIICVSASIALHGQLTPGGGFQGGAALAVLPILFIMAMSRFVLEDKNVNKNSMLVLRSLGLLGIGTTVILPLIIGLVTHNPAYIMQNQIKTDAPISLPSMIFDRMMGGSLWMLNLSEYLAVGAGFTLTFILLSLPESVFKKVLEGEKYATH